MKAFGCFKKIKQPEHRSEINLMCVDKFLRMEFDEIFEIFKALYKYSNDCDYFINLEKMMKKAVWGCGF